jgi:hypothetical protein
MDERFSTSDQAQYQLTIEFISNINLQKWHLTNIYGPTIQDGRIKFINWFYNVDTSMLDIWMMLGDFNLIRSPDNKNRRGGDSSNMLMFNSCIQYLDLEEIPLKGRAYTWSNMQDPPLLKKLDWVFTSVCWTTLFPNTVALPLAKLSSDHTPIKIQIGTSIPRAHIFRFEEYWLDFDGFKEVVEKNWQHTGI